MIDPQLLDWIKQELSKGVPEEQLKRALISKGWTPGTVEEAFNTIQSKSSKKVPEGDFSKDENLESSKKNFPFYIFVILGFIILIVLAYLLLFKWPFNSISSPSVNESLRNQQSPIGILSNSIVCRNIDCMIRASRSCSLANFTFTGSEILLGVNNTGTSSLTISKNGSQCLLYQKVLNQSLTYTNTTIESLLNSGLTFGQVKQQEGVLNQGVSVLIGKVGICSFSNLDNMSVYLTKIKNGNFSGNLSCSTSLGGNSICNGTGDWSLADNCTGDLFNSSSFDYVP